MRCKFWKCNLLLKIELCGGCFKRVKLLLELHICVWDLYKCIQTDPWNHRQKCFAQIFWHSKLQFRSRNCCDMESVWAWQDPRLWAHTGSWAGYGMPTPPVLDVWVQDASSNLRWHEEDQDSCPPPPTCTVSYKYKAKSGSLFMFHLVRKKVFGASLRSRDNLESCGEDSRGQQV